MANGTNRVGVLLNGMGATLGFYKEDKLDFKLGSPYIVSVCIGAVVGILVATQVSNAQFMNVFRYLMIGMLFVIVINPKRWMRKDADLPLYPKYLTVPVFLAIGFYGGFIQMGMGIFFLAALVLLARIPILESNAIKAVTVFIYGALALAIFHFNGFVDWKIGTVMGVAQFLGSWMTARFASRYKGIEKVAYYMLIIAMILAVLKLFGLL